MTDFLRLLTPHRFFGARRSQARAHVLLVCTLLTAPAVAAEKPVASPDNPAPLVTTSRISASIEFGLPALAAAIQRDIPQRLATFDERIACVHRRVLFFRVNANCNIAGYVERTGPVSLYGRDGRVFGSVSIYGTVSGQGANRFTSRIHGEGEARATIEASARPQLRRDWSLDLNFSDGFHWDEPPYLHILGHDIALARYVEPRVRAQLARVRVRALAATRALHLRDKAASAWQQAFEPIKLSDSPEVWLQMTPQSAAFAGIHANGNVLEGTLELTGNAETFGGQAPPATTPTMLPPLGTDVGAPGTFNIILPVDIGYDLLRQKIMDVAAAAPKGDEAIRDVQIYPSSGKVVVGFRVAKSSDPGPQAGEWIYLSATPTVDTVGQSVGLPDLTAAGDASGDLATQLGDDLLNRVRQQAKVSYQSAYHALLDAANQRLIRPLKNGFRMEGRLTSAQFIGIRLTPDAVSIGLRAGGDLKILYGL